MSSSHVDSGTSYLSDYTTCKYLLPFCVLSFSFVDKTDCSTDVFSFDVAQFIRSFILVLMLSVSSLRRLLQPKAASIHFCVFWDFPRGKADI